MEKLRISDALIEITRKCNMSCDHCLRGNAQNKNIDFKHLDTLISKVERFDTVTFTGGEPSLNPEAIDHFVSECKRQGVSISNFYIATNAKKITDKFLLTVLNLYLYCEDKEYCSISISNDQFHERDERSIEMLQSFRFVRFRHETEDKKYKYLRPINLINQGNYATNYNDGAKLKLSPLYFDDIDGRIESNIYLNCNGNIINGCDWSYTNQNRPSHIICHVDDLGIETIIKYNQKQFKLEYA